MDDNFEKRKKVIYDFICDDLYVPMKLKEIAVILQVPKEQRTELKEEILVGRSGQAYRSISGPSKRLWVCGCRR